jgi:hypothetical protein
MGNDHELVQGRPAQDGVEGEVDIRDVEEDALHAVVLGRPKSHQDRDATTQHDRPWSHSREWASLEIGICSFLKATRLMTLRAAPLSTRMWYNLMLVMVGEMSSRSCPTPAMFLG